jgi:hypothetical protein
MRSADFALPGDGRLTVIGHSIGGVVLVLLVEVLLSEPLVQCFTSVFTNI